MIFASVGSMLPFDRFVRAVDDWAARHPATPVFVQIGDGEYAPQHAAWARILSHDLYIEKLRTSRLFVAHVGMGSILQALEMQTQILMMPRRADLGEHTTDHQLHTAERFRNVPGVRIVEDEAALAVNMTELLEKPMSDVAAIAPSASPELLQRIESFVLGR